MNRGIGTGKSQKMWHIFSFSQEDLNEFLGHSGYRTEDFTEEHIEEIMKEFIASIWHYIKEEYPYVLDRKIEEVATEYGIVPDSNDGAE